MTPALLYVSGLSCLGVVQALYYFSGVLGHGLVASALLALIVLACAGVGRILLRWLSIQGLGETERTLIGCTLGIGLLSQGLFLLGAVGLLRLWVVLALLGAAWILGFTEIRGMLASWGDGRNLLRERPWWSALILALLAVTFWMAWVPPHQYDALVYHLPLAAAYLREGRIMRVDHIFFTHFPQNGEMLFSLALLWKSEVLAQLFSWLACALSVAWVFEMGKREMPLSAALGACVLVASHTAVMLLSSAAYVETMAMLWITAAVLCFCRWRETQDHASPQSGWLVLSAVFAGFGLGTKYYAGICPAVLGGVLAWDWARKGKGRQGGVDLAFFTGCSAVAASPWFLKNLFVIGNPVFPFLYDYFPHRGIPWAAESARRYFSAFVEYGHEPGSLISDLLKFPLMAASGSPRFGGGMDILGSLGWGLCLALAPAWVLAARKSRMLRLVLFYVVLHGALWFSTGVVLRFLVVLVPLMALLGAAGLQQVWESMGHRCRFLFVGGLALLGTVNLGLFLYVHTLFASWNVLLGLQPREEYLSQRLDYYPCARFAREHLDPKARILLVGEQRGYYVTQEQATTSLMGPNPFVEWANRSASPAQLARLLREEGRFTHMIVVPREAKRLAGYGILSFTEQGSGHWAGLEPTYLKQLHAPGACALFEILEPEGGGSPRP